MRVSERGGGGGMGREVERVWGGGGWGGGGGGGGGGRGRGGGGGGGGGGEGGGSHHIGACRGGRPPDTQARSFLLNTSPTPRAPTKPRIPFSA